MNTTTEEFSNNYEAHVSRAAEYLRTRLGKEKAEFGIVLGSGLGDLADAIENPTIIPYAEIPSFPTTTVAGHTGKLIKGTLEGVPVIGLSGRIHYYEHADLGQAGMLKAVFPVHVLAELGVPNYFATNAAGGLREDLSIGDAMIIESHIHLQPNPLLGRHKTFNRVDNGERVWRFQPMNDAYDPKLRALLTKAGSGQQENIHSGVYAAVTGPTYETEAESIMYREVADAVGMSTTGEVIVARNRGMRVLAFSCITNLISADGTNAANHAEVQAILNSSEVKNRLSTLVTNFFELYREKKH